jgi:exosortase A-associated hydrolase 2
MLRPEVIEGRSGRLLCVVHAPAAGPTAGSVVVAPPFAEEMNKSRRMITLFAQAAAQRGFETVVPDLSATGDSDGEFADARWEDWSDDLERVLAAVERRTGRTPVVLAIRSGALVASSVLERSADAAHGLVLWAPVTDGDRYMKQFLRLRMAASLSQENRETVAHLEAALRGGTTLEVGGYALAPPLWAALSARKFAPPCPAGGGRVAWFELAAAEPCEFAPAAQKGAAALAQFGWQVEARALGGAPFWGTAEIAEVPELVAASAAALDGLR